MKMTYGNRLRAARKQKDWSQETLAKRANVGPGTISKIERGDQDASTYDIELALALGVQPIWLKNGDPKHAPDWLSNPEEKEPDDTPRTYIEKVLDAVEDAMYDSGVQFTEEQKRELYKYAVNFAGTKQLSQKLIAHYMLETIRTEFNKLP